ncbi:hypothetical protein G6F60_014457 [Rhizopus arrhizus]|nr:hypothetical protein G6F60_014457 [Rhizopus arrhizus]
MAAAQPRQHQHALQPRQGRVYQLQPEPPAERRARQLAAPLRRGRAPTRTPAAGRDLQRGAEPAAGARPWAASCRTPGARPASPSAAIASRGAARFPTAPTMPPASR